jgi:2-enoate reductase
VATPFSHLLEPGAIGSLELRNRIVMPGMGVFLGHDDGDGALNEEQLAHWEARAAGGAGLVIAEVTPVQYPVGATTLRQPGLSTDAHEASFSTLAERVHRHGAALGVQLVHHGKVAIADVAAGRPLLVPSADARPELANDLTSNLTQGETERLFRAMGGRLPEVREANERDLAEVVDAFGEAALRARRAGLDCVEIHGAHGYLISSFLSRAYNRRGDRWGGTPDNRARLLCEVVRAVKARAGSDFPVIVRLDGNEYRTPEGISLEEACATARLAEAAGADAVHVSAYGDPTSGVAFTDGPLPWREAQYVGLAEPVKRVVGVPVIAVGRLLPGRADRLVRDGSADFVAMGRQLLADPDLPAKLRSGDPVRPCINCFVCVATAFFDEPSTCAVNARMGQQAGTELEQAAARRVVVVGAGPAGLELARTAARRGHFVTVLERASRVGGTALLSGVVMPVNAELVRYLELDARSAGAEIRTGTEATPDLVESLGPDVVVVATGARRPPLGAKGADLPHVWTGDDLRSLLGGEGAGVEGRLSAGSRALVRAASALGVTATPARVRRASAYWLPFGRRVVVVGGGLVGLELAELLAERRRQVTVLEPGPVLGLEMAHPRRSRAVDEARLHGVDLRTGARVSAIETDRVVFETTALVEESVPADDVVVATGTVADPEAADRFRALGCEVHVIGDASAVGYLFGAIHSGFDLGRTL